MNRKSQFFIFFLALMLIVSCQEDPEPTDPTEPPVPTGNFEVKDLQVKLPQGSSYNFAGSELLSFGESFPVGADGKTKTVSTPGMASIVYLFDQAGNPILAGFISDQTSEISPQSTAIVLLSYAIGMNLREEGFTELFLDQIDKLPEAVEWKEMFAELWKSDPLILEKGTYITQLREVMEKLVPEPKVIDIRANAKVSDISVDEGDFKSGLQIFEDGLGQFSVNNKYRRRAHAFLYKMSYKDMQDKPHQILGSVGATSDSDRDFAISPSAAPTSLTGVLGASIEGKSSDFAEVKTGPNKLDILEIESEATYKIHIVGPGRPLSEPITTAEKSKLERLTIETYVLDFIFPLMMEMYGYKDDLKNRGVDPNVGSLVKLIDEFGNFLKATPAVYDLVKAGDYIGATRTTLELLVTGAIDARFENLSKSVYNQVITMATSRGYKLPNAAAGQKALGRASKILQVVNTALLSADFVRIAYMIEYSSQMDEWTIKARSTKVSLSPKESTVRSRGSKAIEAKVKNLQTGGDTHPFFVWKTSGKFGYIQDTKGNKGESFESSDAKITYYSTTSAAQLPEENNWEYVYVEAFLGSQSIGKDTVKLNLKKSVYELKPTGVTLSGKKGSTNSATLYLERTDGTAPDFSDKKVVWTTVGKHGKLKGNGALSSTVTTFGSNSIKYECTDKDTQKATEKVHARIYAKSSVGGDYFLYEELEATININNEDDIKIVYYELVDYSWGPIVSGIYTNCGAGTHFLIKPEPNAISYHATVLEYGPEGLPRLTGTSASWQATKATNEAGFYEFAVRSAGAGSSPTWIGPPPCGDFIQNAKARKGTAQVIIRIKKP